jgi:hypothetical protein
VTDLSAAADPRHPSLAAGAAPNTTNVDLGGARLCGTCSTLGRLFPGIGWKHCAVGFDGHHPFDPDAYERIRATAATDTIRGPWTERDRELHTESELRLLDGNR